MKLNRKTFLRRLGLGALGLAAVGRAGADGGRRGAERVAGADTELGAALRDAYLLEEGFTYFNTGGLGPTPRGVLEGAERVRRELQRRSETGHLLIDEARPELARFLGAQADEVALVRNATEGNGIVAAGLRLKAGDEVIIDAHAHPGGSFAWLNQAKLRGVVPRYFEPDPTGVEGNLRRIEELITPRTRVVAVSHVTAPTGLVLPVRELAARCRGRGLWLHVDAAQSLGMFPFSVAELGCDSLAASGHKWLGAPLGTGLLYVRRDRLDEVVPVLVGAHSGGVERLPGELEYFAGAVRFEYGTRDAAAIDGLRQAAAWQEAIGRARIARHGHELAARVAQGLTAVPGVEVLTPEHPALRASMVTFRTPRLGFRALFDQLITRYRMRCRPVSEQGMDAVRVSTHVFNSAAEVDALVDAVGELVGAA